MDIKNKKKIRFVAASYLILSLMYLAMITILIGAMDWHGLDQAIHDTYAISETLLFLLGSLLLNLLMAWGSWRVASLSHSYQRLLIVAAIFIAAVSLVDSILIWWRWHQGLLPLGIGSAAVIGRTLVAMGYILLAFSLAKFVAASNAYQAVDKTSSRPL